MCGEGDQDQGVQPQSQGGRPADQPPRAHCVLGTTNEEEIVEDHGAKLGHCHHNEGMTAGKKFSKGFLYTQNIHHNV